MQENADNYQWNTVLVRKLLALRPCDPKRKVVCPVGIPLLFSADTGVQRVVDKVRQGEQELRQVSGDDAREELVGCITFRADDAVCCTTGEGLAPSTDPVSYLCDNCVFIYFLPV